MKDTPRENLMFNGRTEEGIKPLTMIGRSVSNASSLTSLCTDISPSSSHFFEVLFIGRVRISNNSNKKITDAFIDTALFRLRHSELHKNSGYHDLPRRPSSHDVVTKVTGNNVNGTKSSPEKYFMKPPVERSRANSIASMSTMKEENYANNANDDMKQNRTMVFHVGRTDLRLVSPDRKEILLHKQLKDVINCVQSIDEPNHFGVICRDANSMNAYLFKCESDSVVTEIIGAIKQSYAVDKKKKNRAALVMNCDHCPMVWFQKLVTEVEGLQDQDVQNTILKRIEELPEDEQEMVLNKLNATASVSIMDDNCAEQNQLLLTLLKAHCEGKQSRHVHDTAEQRHEFLNHYLGGGTGTFITKAKRSLTNSFDQLLNRKSSKSDFAPLNKELSLPSKTFATKESNAQPAVFFTDISEESKTKSGSTGSLPSVNKENAEETVPDPPVSPHRALHSPKTMRDIFLTVGSSPRCSVIPSSDNEVDEEMETGSWRHNIFRNVITPNKHALRKELPKKSRDRAELRSLWKKAINQQILLIRMEKENAKLYARQEEATMKRIKLEYDDICPFIKENTEVWETITNKKDRKYDDQMLLQAVKQGVPRSKRGEVWLFLAEQHCSRMPPPIDLSKFPKYNLPYDQLLKELTSQQHAILIDLGRTFPNHSYFMSPLGPGQLALYNLLKAYSLLDEEVGYCQGLSFIAGILLLHMSEDEAFSMLRHLMFRRNLRHQYLPDMAGLQIQLYQLTRLLKDHLPQLYEHFDKHEISPILYAAPWLLTIFASQFPLGFVVRVFDFIFIEGSGVLFKVILALLSYHQDNLLACDGFEQIMDYLKITVPLIEKSALDNVVKIVCTTDISKHLLEYSVEYNVLQEELATPRPETKKLKQLEEANQVLRNKNQLLMEQLEIAVTNNSRSETVRVKHLSQINKLESEVRALEVTVNTLGNFISTLVYGRSDIEIPNDVLRILSQLNMAERRRSLPKASLTDLSLENDSSKDSNITLGQLKSHSLNPKQSASYFSKSFDQIRQQKLSVLPNDVSNKLLQDGINSTKGLQKSFSDTRHIKFDKILEESVDRSQSLGRTLTSQEMETLKLFQKNYCKEIRKQDTSKPTLKVSRSSFELGSSPEGHDSGDWHSEFPLNCGEVNISLQSRKLKSLRPMRIKSEMQINVPRNLIRGSESSNDSDVFEFDNGRNGSTDNNDSAFGESIDSLDANGNISEKTESTVSAIKDSKLSNSDITIS